MDVSYFRYQDDILILCQTLRSLNRCKQRLLHVLQERKLSLSGKKTRIGSINKGFHFLGIQYPETQPLDNITRQAVSRSFNKGTSELNLSYVGGGRGNLATRRTVFIANPHCSSCKDFAKSARASQMDGQRWGFSPTNHQLFASIVSVVG